LNRELIGVNLLLIVFGLPGVCQNPEPAIMTARINIRAVDAFGTPLSGFEVDSFVDEKGHNRLFRGPTATEVPFGHYWITLHSDSAYLSSSFETDIAASDVLITAAFEWGGVENVRITGYLRGNLSGFPSGWSNWWCKASGLYSRLEYESAVNQDALRFDFGDVPPGVYLVSCVANQKFVAVRTIRIAADTKPFTIDYKPGEDGEAVKH
jgi:hypothetical protein